MCTTLLRFAAFLFSLSIVQGLLTPTRTQNGKPVISTAAQDPVCPFYALGMSGPIVNDKEVYYTLQVEHGQAVRGTKPHKINFPSTNNPDLFNKFVSEMTSGIYLFGPTTAKSATDEEVATRMYKFVDSDAVCAFKLEDGCFDDHKFFGPQALSDFTFSKLVHYYDEKQFYVQGVSRKELATQKPYHCLHLSQ